VLVHSSHSRHRWAHHFLAYIISIHSIQRQHWYRWPQVPGSQDEILAIILLRKYHSISGIQWLHQYLRPTGFRDRNRAKICHWTKKCARTVLALYVCIFISTQAPGSQCQLSTNHFIEDLGACGPWVALIGWCFLVVVTTFPRPLSSQEIDVGISIRTEEVESRNDCSEKTSSI
jgi:hypothetical protein